MHHTTLDIAILQQSLEIKRQLRAIPTALVVATETETLVFRCCECQRTYNVRGEYVRVPRWVEPEEWSHGLCPQCLIDAYVVNGLDPAKIRWAKEEKP